MVSLLELLPIWVILSAVNCMHNATQVESASSKSNEKVHLITPSGYSYVLTHKHHHKHPYESSGTSGTSSSGCSGYLCSTSANGDSSYKYKKKPVYHAPSTSHYFPKPHYKPSYESTSSSGVSGAGSYLPPKKHHYKQPSTGYGTPSSTGIDSYKHKKHHYKAPTTSYGAPSSSGTDSYKHKKHHYKVPTTEYGAPSSSGMESYKHKKHHYKVPTTSYGVPSSSGVESYKHKKHHYKIPTTGYGVPSSSGIESYKHKKHHYKVPTTSYGVPSSSGMESYKHKKHNYKIPTSSYGAPSSSGSSGSGSYPYKKPESSYGVPSSSGMASYYKKKHHHHHGITHAIFKPAPLYCPLCSPKTLAMHAHLLHLHHAKRRTTRGKRQATSRFLPRVRYTPVKYYELPGLHKSGSTQYYIVRRPIFTLMPNLLTKPYFIPYSSQKQSTTTPEPTTTTESNTEPSVVSFIGSDVSAPEITVPSNDSDSLVTMQPYMHPPKPSKINAYFKYNTTENYAVQVAAAPATTQSDIPPFMMPPSMDSVSEYAMYNVDLTTSPSPTGGADYVPHKYPGKPIKMQKQWRFGKH